MRAAIKTGKEAKPEFERDYRTALSQCVSRGDETALRRAYELGRRAIAEKRSLMEIASLHHGTLLRMLEERQRANHQRETLCTAGDFLAEMLSPYEMAQRGVQDAIAGLRQINETLEEEIKRIAYAVHDEAGQLLVAVHLALSEVANDLPKNERERLARVEELLKQVEDQLRRYSHELRPTVLDDLGWIPALRFLADSVSRRSKIRIQVKTTFGGRLQGPVEIALYRIVQEALTNAAKHAKSKRVWIRVARKGRGLSCVIRDDGTGFDVRAMQADRQRRGLGLIGMRERLNAIGGTLSIESAPGKGTTLLIQLPMETRNDTRTARR